MQLGYLCRFREEEVARAARLGFDCLELHANSICDDLTSIRAARSAAKKARALLDDYAVGVSCVACYGNFLTTTVSAAVKTFRSALAIAQTLGAPVVSALAGSLPDASTDESLARYAKVFTRVAAEAEKAGLPIAFENWPGFGGELPLRSVNLARSPALWRRMFDAVDSEALGLEFDPSHLVRIGVDHLAALKEFGPRVYHVHAKDTEMLYDSIAEHGYYGGRPFRYRIPGYGEIHWAELVAALVEIGYDGGIAIEHEDPVFSGERFEEGLVRGHDMLYSLVHPGAV